MGAAVPALESQGSAMGRLKAQFTALVAIGLVAASGGLLFEMNRKAQPAAPAVMVPQG